MKKIVDTSGLSFKDFFFFDKMFTPKIITVIYWMSLVLIVFSGLTIIFSSFLIISYSFGSALLGIITGIITIVGGAVFTRIGYEIICVLFNINRNIEKLALDKSTDDNQ
ncbi:MULTISPECIES: DUF4282 domain-containing protein [Gilliamella]|jgi:hypothetical protein|uniref:DUF4282 domain-containing protein n=1 Tax=Gilliamella TaxID=1193503 RepID=UPI00080E5802|nr:MULTISPECIES: DUF4282 domain-containing protein [Gilliamella]MBI0114371.1 DUF4282 domain-containing protein [Gilliamella sp. W8123]MBI0118260.1 DUF4282 domain-containing protein [Gilliamella sp. W8129]OCG03346.1 hypothetical protein A9G15_05905 [Gilliamella apis]OTQ59236.1 hypothetical protein B6C98_10000 [Gilliamella apis]OTQ64186.1 hypothetical protein B6D09_07735 [Gilliamella apis]